VDTPLEQVMVVMGPVGAEKMGAEKMGSLPVTVRAQTYSIMRSRDPEHEY
jgi:hypothetical protein